MGLLHQIFTVEELKSLDAKQLDILKTAIQNELRTSAAAAISPKIRDVYNRLKAS